MASSASQNAPKSTLKKGNDGGILKKTEQERNEAFDEYFEQTGLSTFIQDFMHLLGMKTRGKILPSNPYPTLLSHLRQMELLRRMELSDGIILKEFVPSLDDLTATTTSTTTTTTIIPTTSVSTIGVNGGEIRVCSMILGQKYHAWGLSNVLECIKRLATCSNSSSSSTNTMMAGDNSTPLGFIEELLDQVFPWPFVRESIDEGCSLAAYTALVGRNALALNFGHENVFEMEQHIFIQADHLEKAITVFARQLIREAFEAQSLLPRVLSQGLVVEWITNDSIMNRKRWTMESINASRTGFINAIKIAVISKGTFQMENYHLNNGSSSSNSTAANRSSSRTKFYRCIRQFLFHYAHPIDIHQNKTFGDNSNTKTNNYPRALREGFFFSEKAILEYIKRFSHELLLSEPSQETFEDQIYKKTNASKTVQVKRTSTDGIINTNTGIIHNTVNKTSTNLSGSFTTTSGSTTTSSATTTSSTTSRGSPLVYYHGSYRILMEAFVPVLLWKKSLQEPSCEKLKSYLYIVIDGMLKGLPNLFGARIEELHTLLSLLDLLKDMILFTSVSTSPLSTKTNGKNPSNSLNSSQEAIANQIQQHLVSHFANTYRETLNLLQSADSSSFIGLEKLLERQMDQCADLLDHAMGFKYDSLEIHHPQNESSSSHPMTTTMDSTNNTKAAWSSRTSLERRKEALAGLFPALRQLQMMFLILENTIARDYARLLLCQETTQRLYEAEKKQEQELFLFLQNPKAVTTTTKNKSKGERGGGEEGTKTTTQKNKWPDFGLIEWLHRALYAGYERNLVRQQQQQQQQQQKQQQEQQMSTEDRRRSNVSGISTTVSKPLISKATATTAGFVAFETSLLFPLWSIDKLESISIMDELVYALKQKKYPPSITKEMILAQWMVDSHLDIALESAIMNVLAEGLPLNPFSQITANIRVFHARQLFWATPLHQLVVKQNVLLQLPTMLKSHRMNLYSIQVPIGQSTSTNSTTTTVPAATSVASMHKSVLFSGSMGILALVDVSKLLDLKQRWSLLIDGPSPYVPSDGAYGAQNFSCCIVEKPFDLLSIVTTRNNERDRLVVVDPLEMHFTRHYVIEGMQFAKSLAFFSEAVMQDIKYLHEHPDTSLEYISLTQNDEDICFSPKDFFRFPIKTMRETIQEQVKNNKTTIEVYLMVQFVSSSLSTFAYLKKTYVFHYREPPLGRLMSFASDQLNHQIRFCGVFFGQKDAEIALTPSYFHPIRGGVELPTTSSSIRTTTTAASVLQGSSGLSIDTYWSYIQEIYEEEVKKKDLFIMHQLLLLKMILYAPPEHCKIIQHLTNKQSHHATTTFFTKAFESDLIRLFGCCSHSNTILPELYQLETLCMKLSQSILMETFQTQVDTFVATLNHQVVPFLFKKIEFLVQTFELSHLTGGFEMIMEISNSSEKSLDQLSISLQKCGIVLKMLRFVIQKDFYENCESIRQVFPATIYHRSHTTYKV